MKYNLGNMTIFIDNTYEEMSQRAADIFSDELTKNKNGVFGFATGSTPLGLYDELIKRYEANEISFEDIKSFNLDEYHPISQSNEQSYVYFMKNNLFNHIDIKEENIHIPNGECEDPILECERYEELINSMGGIDFQILGIGENGHIGFNEPGTSFESETNHTELTESTIEANSRFFENIDDVPKHALSMGMKTIMNTKKIILLATGKKKADIICESFLGEITPDVPASILQRHEDVTILLDNDAGHALKLRLK